MRAAPAGKLRAFSKAASTAFQSPSSSSRNLLFPYPPKANSEADSCLSCCFTPKFWLLRPGYRYAVRLTPSRWLPVLPDRCV